MSRRKGARCEIEVARLLEAWWGKLEPACRFVRTPGSGGWGDPTLRAGFRASGDLSTTATRFPWCVEVKAREAWTWARLAAGKPSPVWAWWRQAQTAAREQGLLPMLVFKKSREPWQAMIPAETRTSREPAVVWEEGELARVDFGFVEPKVIEFACLARLSPRDFASPASPLR